MDNLLLFDVKADQHGVYVVHICSYFLKAPHQYLTHNLECAKFRFKTTFIFLKSLLREFIF